MQSRSALIVILGLSLTASVPAFPQGTQGTAKHKTTQDQVNESSVFIAGGSVGATYHTLANDIALVTSSDDLRVLAVTTTSAVQNIRDLVFLRSIDLALTTPLVLNRFTASGELGPDLKRKIVYVAPLVVEDFHLLVQPEINSIEDLRGKRVGFHSPGGQTAISAARLFEALGISVQGVTALQPEAIEKMRRRELDATICVCAKAIPAYAALEPETGFKFIEVPYPAAMEADFLPSKITAQDYPNLLPKDKSVQTIGMYMVLVTLNWPKGSMRYARNSKFAQAFLSKFDNFLRPPRHASWKTANPAATVPGWQRFKPAQEWLDQYSEEKRARQQASFGKFLDERKKGGDGPGAAEKERLFREFLDWMRRNRN
jgi:TRAP-type uncharacterized transport system substrate-binding protein